MMVNQYQQQEQIDGITVPVTSSQDCESSFEMEQNYTNATNSVSSPKKRKSTVEEQTSSLSSSNTNESLEAGKALSTNEKSTGRWTAQEHEAFITGLSMYGREWKRVAQLIPTRTSAQVRSHAQKYFHHLEQHHQRHLVQNDDSTRIRNVQSPRSDDSFDFNTEIMEDRSRSRDTACTSYTFHPNAIDVASMSDSVREQALRIVSDPSSVHNEVNATLVQLRQRYQELQNRYAKLHHHQQQHQNHHTLPALNEGIVDQHLAATNTRPSTSSTVQSLQSKTDEQIVVEMLQARLQQHSDNISISNNNYDNFHSNESYDGDVETDDNNEDME